MPHTTPGFVAVGLRTLRRPAATAGRAALAAMLAAFTLASTSVAHGAQADTPSVRMDAPANGPRSARPRIVPGARGEALHAVRHTRLRLATGVELHVAEAGPIDGMPVLFLHGYTDSWFSWSPMLERLPGGIRAIVPTQRGHGDSERPACCYGLADFAADAVALLDTLGIDRAAVVGHSLGSFVAQRIAIDRPDRVTRLVLIASGFSGRVDPVLEMYDAARTLTDPVDPAFIRAFQESTAAKPLPSEFMDRVIVESGKLPARVWHDVMSSLIDADASDELHRIEMPTLVLWGDRDAVFVRRDQDALLEAIPGSRLIVYPGVGHAPNWERPDRVAADLAAFLRAGRAGS